MKTKDIKITLHLPVENIEPFARFKGWLPVSEIEHYEDESEQAQEELGISAEDFVKIFAKKYISDAMVEFTKEEIGNVADKDIKEIKEAEKQREEESRKNIEKIIEVV